MGGMSAPAVSGGAPSALVETEPVNGTDHVPGPKAWGVDCLSACLSQFSVLFSTTSIRAWSHRGRVRRKADATACGADPGPRIQQAPRKSRARVTARHGGFGAADRPAQARGLSNEGHVCRQGPVHCNDAVAQAALPSGTSAGLSPSQYPRQPQPQPPFCFCFASSVKIISAHSAQARPPLLTAIAHDWIYPPPKARPRRFLLLILLFPFNSTQPSHLGLPQSLSLSRQTTSDIVPPLSRTPHPRPSPRLTSPHSTLLPRPWAHSTFCARPTSSPGGMAR